MARDLAEAEWFASFEAVSPVDVWSVDVSGLRIEVNEDGFLLCRSPIPPSRLRLVQTRRES